MLKKIIIENLTCSASVGVYENEKLNNFTWINNFYSQDYSKYILENWQSSDEAFQVKNEFTENAECIDSRFYKVFKLI